MSIINSFDKNKDAILNPSNMIKKSKYNINTIIINFTKKLMDELIDTNKIELIDDIVNKGVNGFYNIYKIKGTNIAIYMTFVGAPSTVALIEEFSVALNAKNFILFGSCGVLNKDITYNKIIVPTSAYRDEGTSYHYKEASDYIDISNYKVVSEFLTSNNIDHVCGKTWTTDAFFRETKENFEKRKEDGCISVEMEISACQAVCDFRGYNFYPFLYAADNLDTTIYDKRGSFKATLSHYDLALMLAKHVDKS